MLVVPWSMDPMKTSLVAGDESPMLCKSVPVSLSDKLLERIRTL